jgi:hypothetical protein
VGVADWLKMLFAGNRDALASFAGEDEDFGVAEKTLEGVFVVFAGDPKPVKAGVFETSEAKSFGCGAGCEDDLCTSIFEKGFGLGLSSMSSVAVDISVCDSGAGDGEVDGFGERENGDGCWVLKVGVAGCGG